MGKDTTIAVDLAKSVFEIAVSSLPGIVAQSAEPQASSTTVEAGCCPK